MLKCLPCKRKDWLTEGHGHVRLLTHRPRAAGWAHQTHLLLQSQNLFHLCLSCAYEIMSIKIRLEVKIPSAVNYGCTVFSPEGCPGQRTVHNPFWDCAVYLPIKHSICSQEERAHMIEPYPIELWCLAVGTCLAS